MRHRLARLIVTLFALGAAALPARSEVPLTTNPGTQEQVATAAGDSFAVVVWSDNRNAPSDPSDIYGAAIDYFANPLWPSTRDGVRLTTAAGAQTEPVAAVGADSLIWVCWRDQRTCSSGQVYVQGYRRDGTPLCQANGLLLPSECSNPVLEHTVISTLPGTAVVLWHRRWYDYSNTVHEQLWAQQVSASDCSLKWGSYGTLVWDPGQIGSQYKGALQPVAVSDGAGGFIVAIYYDVNGRLYVRRVNSAGVAQWGGVVTVCTSATTQQMPAIASDGSGGAIIAWQDGNAGSRVIRAQRIDGNGVVQWGACGKVVASGGGDLVNAQVVRSTSGRTFVVWEADYGASNSDIFAQRINFLGDTLATRIPICTALYGQTLPRAVAGPAGSCFIVWQDGRDLAIGDDADVFGQRLDASGTILCAVNGVPIGGAPDNGEGRQYDPRVVAVQVGGSTRVAGAKAFVTWSDTRNGNPDVYGAPMADDCRPGVTDVDPTATQPSLDPLSVFPNPFVGRTKIWFRLHQPSAVTMRIYDVGGRVVRELVASDRLAAGDHIVEWNGVAEHGTRASAGIYFCRLVIAGHPQARRVIFVK